MQKAMGSMAHKIFSNICKMLVLIVPLCGYALAQNSGKEELMVHYRRAEEALRTGHSDTAAAEFKEILKLDPGNPEASANLGVIAYKQADFPQAKQLFAGALKRN